MAVYGVSKVGAAAGADQPGLEGDRGGPRPGADGPGPRGGRRPRRGLLAGPAGRRPGHRPRRMVGRRPLAGRRRRARWTAPAATTDEAVLVFSSGTTGLPKAVRHTHRSIGAGHRTTGARRWASGPTTGSRWPRRPRTSSGSSTCWRRPSAGATVRLHRRFDLDEVLRRIEAERMTLEMAVAPIALAMANHPDLERYDLSSLRYIMWGATPVSEQRGRGGHRADRGALAPGLRRQRGAGHRRQPGGATRDRWRLDSAGLPPTGVRAPGGRPRHRRGPAARARSGRSRSSARRPWPATCRRRPPPRPSPTAGTAPATWDGWSPRGGSTSPTGPRR